MWCNSISKWDKAKCTAASLLLFDRFAFDYIYIYSGRVNLSQTCVSGSFWRPLNVSTCLYLIGDRWFKNIPWTCYVWHSYVAGVSTLVTRQKNTGCPYRSSSSTAIVVRYFVKRLASNTNIPMLGFTPNPQRAPKISRQTRYPPSYHGVIYV